ncbi:MAG: DUF1015 family protein [Bacteroidota bacterium]
MATVHPFRALRPLPEHAEEVACVPYDVINTEEALQLAAGRPRSFLHVIRPEIDLPPGTDEHDEAVYAKGAENLRALAADEATIQEETPALYVYQLVMDERPQVGVFACVSVAEYDDDTILKHEKTRPAKEDDRTRHILTQEAHAEPVMLTYRGTDAIDDLVNDAMEGEPLYDFTATDGVQHTIWKVDAPQPLVDAFAEVDNLYIADGHHRCAAASRAAKERPDNSEAQRFPAVLFPVEEMEILPYNRTIKKLPAGKRRFLQQLEYQFDVEPVLFADPDQPGEIRLYFGDSQWYRLDLPVTERGGVADTLDVARLAEHILEPLLRISDPRTDENIAFVGGIRGTGELERLVNIGEAELGIAMYATDPDELLDVSDAGELMPPKSTWFEPKLRSGLLVHLF